ncbi:MAG: Wzt carbohydrate-binding domain-containing protein, partial [Parcubacteria group bacterium]
ENAKKRIEDEKKKQEEERKNKVAEIIRVEFLDKNGEAKNTFETGSAIDIRIDFKVYKKVKLINFGIGIHSISGGNIIGYNTQMDDYRIDTDKNFIILHFDKMPVLTGEYYMNVACWSNIEQEHYDYKPACKTLKMFSVGQKKKYRGFLDVPHEWIMG